MAALLALGVPSLAIADVRPLVRSLAAVPGAPLLVPVRVEGPDRGMRVVMRGEGARERRCEARLAWPVSVVDAVALGRWATASNPVRLEAERPLGSRDAYLIVDVPLEAADSGSGDGRGAATGTAARSLASGTPPGGTSAAVGTGMRASSAARGDLELSIDGTEVRIALHAPAGDALLGRLAARASRLAPEGAPEPRLSRPDSLAPFERFRTTIGAAIRGWEAPPALAPGSPDAAAAEATTALWLAALARIAASSEGVAAEMAETLVATCHDPAAPAPVAAWLAAPGELGALLALALDRSRADVAVVDAVASWLAVRSPLLAWIDDETPDEIALALANPTSSEEVVRLQWILADEPPLAAVVAPAEVLRVRLARPARPSIDGVAILDDRVERLRIENRGQARILEVAPPSVAAGVAGQGFAGFVPPLDLATVSGAARRANLPVPPTFASIRPRLDGWEIFVEARTGPSAGAATRIDAVEVVGPQGEVVTIAADGSIDDPSGSLAEGTSVAFARHADRYRAAFPVPPAWIDRSAGRALVALGFRRRIGDAAVGGACVSFDAPFASTPWREVPRTIVVDLFGRGAR